MLFALLAVTVVSAVGVASASAHVWEVKEGAVWKVANVAEKSGTTETPAGKGLLLKSSLGNELECEGTGTGSVGSAGNAEVDLTSTITVGTCVNIKSCTNPKAKAVDLEWASKLLVSELRDELLATNKGNPGWESECGGAKLTCTAPKGTAAVRNNTTNNTVEIEFDNKTENATCGLGVTGTVRGVIIVNWPTGTEGVRVT